MNYGPTKKIELVDGPRCGERIDVPWDTKPCCMLTLDLAIGSKLTLDLGAVLRKVDPESYPIHMLDYSVRDGDKAIFQGYVRISS